MNNIEIEKSQLYHITPENLSLDQINKIRIDREHEIEILENHLISNNSNVLLHGVRGVGKTFLVRLFEIELSSRYPKILPVNIKLMSLSEYNPIDEIAAFSLAVLMQICVFIWKNILNRDYLELREQISQSAHEKQNYADNRIELISRIYSILFSKNKNIELNVRNRWRAGVFPGDSAVYKLSSEILPFEYGEFIDEIKEKVLKEYGIERILLLTDEANHMKLFRQEELLNRYFNLFKSKKTQFLFVASSFDWENEKYIPQCFEHVLELNGFNSVSDIREFSNGLLNNRYQLTEQSVDFLLSECNGIPRIIMDLLRSATYKFSIAGITNKKIEKQMLSDLYRQMAKRIEFEKKQFNNFKG